MIQKPTFDRSHRAGHSGSKEKSLKEAKLPPLPAFVQPQAEKREISSSFKGRKEEIHQFFEHFKHTNDDINRKLDDIYQKTGWNPAFLKSYLNNPNNFNEAQWEQLQKEREDLEAFKLAEDRQAEKKTASNPKSTKGRRGKTAGARRNWIPMR